MRSSYGYQKRKVYFISNSFELAELVLLFESHCWFHSVDFTDGLCQRVQPIFLAKLWYYSPNFVHLKRAKSIIKMDANFLFEYFCNPINQPDKELQPKKYAAAQLFLS